MSHLTCPVCRGQMREIDKLGVHIDTCTQCRGVWLDRGELEKLAALMSGGPSGASAAPAPPTGFLSGGFAVPNAQPAARPPVRRDWDDDDDDDDRRRYDGHHQPQRKRSSFLDFFD